MQDWKYWWTAPAMIFVGILGPGLLGQAHAHADTGDVQKVERAVCSTLDQYPSAGGVAGVGQALVEEGLTTTEAAQVIVTSVHNYCPEYMPLLERIANQYGGGSTTA